MKLGIIGHGFVGKATSLFKGEVTDVFIYDKDEDKREPISISLKDLIDCDFVFICVPTPMEPNGSCHTRIVEECIDSLKTEGVQNKDIIVRSTVPVGFCKSYGVNFMPEFLTESNWREDFKNNDSWILGVYDDDDNDLKTKFLKLISSSKTHGKIKHEEVFFCSSKEAELVKLTRNVFLATKVSFFNEIYEFCTKAGLDFNMVSFLVGKDKRIGKSHTQVPGPDGKRGFGGTCFPKDISSLNFQMNEFGMTSYIVESVLKRNIQVDRVGQDWKLDKGRAIV